jgi:hypothetical protein
VRQILVGLILVYQGIAPRTLRDRCVFLESCSNFAIRKTRERGIRAGVAAIARRMHSCRPGYFRLPPSSIYPDIGSPVRLVDGTIVDMAELSPRVQAELH